MSKVAILIDGGYFLKRLPTVCPTVDVTNPRAVVGTLNRLVTSHLRYQNKILGNSHPRSLLYRIFYYDAKPYTKKEHRPISKRAVDYAKSSEATFRLALFDLLRRTSSVAVRLGEVRRERAWALKEEPQKRLLKGEIGVGDLIDEDFALGLRQKAVDMRIGVDIASLTLKRQVQTIILVAGDADFVPAAKLARREGVRIILDPLWRSVCPDLFEHIDGLNSGFRRPGARRAVVDQVDDEQDNGEEAP